MNEFIEAGKIVNTHGINGEMKVEVWLDGPAFFKKFRRVFIGNTAASYKVLSAREQKGFILLKVEGIDDLNTAMTFKNKIVYINRGDAHLKKGEYFLGDILGAKVIDEDGTEIGILEEIFETPAQPVYVVKGETEHLIPAVPEFIKAADIENRILTVKLIEGM